MFTYDQVYSANLEYFGGSALAAKAFTDKYALRDSNDVFYEKLPTDMHHRMAREFARIESKYGGPNALTEDEIYQWLADWTIIPQGSPMAGIGNPYQLQSLSNCFVIEPAQDSYGGIFLADQRQAQIMKRRGGVGHDISAIRPKGLPTSNAARTTDGIGVFMERFSNTTREVAQNGRRGALMLSISGKHPEIGTFINIKKDKKKVTGANISLRIYDDFMRAVKNKGKYTLQWPVDSQNPVYQVEIDAEEYWNEMMKAAWESAEPGILFWDNIIKNSPADCYADVGYRTSSTNPCGELPLSPYDSCRLLVVNLTKFVVNPYTPNAYFDWDHFDKAATVAQRLLDDLVDLELEVINKIIAKIKSDPEEDEVKAIELSLWEKILTATGEGRRTGLGETGLGDTLAMLGVRYGDDRSISLTSDIHRRLALSSYACSILLAKQRGCFKVFNRNKEKGHPFISKMLDELDTLSTQWRDMYMENGRRNIANLTTAPAGTVSMLAQLGSFKEFGVSSGCEPAFRLEYTRRKKIMGDTQDKVDFVDDLGDRWMEFKMFHPGHLMWAKVNNKDPKADLEESPYWKATSADIDWVRKIDVQAAAQYWIDHSISNTTNLPEDVSLETVKQVYMRGWETGCKGITIYRAKSRSGVMVEKKDDSRGVDSIIETHAPKRPESLPADIHRATVKGKEYIIIVGLMEDKPYEIFCGFAQNIDVGKKEKKGTIVKRAHKSGIATYDLVLENGTVHADIADLFDNPEYGAFTRTLSTSLRHGVPVQYIVEQLRKDKHSTMTSFSSVIARVLAKSYIADGTTSQAEKKCLECGSTNLGYLQGCVSCLDCGYSKCG